ncbi:hypothetical protein CEE44_01535 [Candidatus Woesearchaeota archaeon B3_Woes]|nr:MAG: hypothetical protein CEE44_01535 [Candidatus Woesearchaeota archaeon B3_Woes]
METIIEKNKLYNVPYQKNMIKRETSIKLPTQKGEFKLLLYTNLVDNSLISVLVKGNPKNESLVRVHSQCFTGETFLSKKCDCRYQLDKAMSMIRDEKEGIIIYLPQEGRGIGLLEKIKAYKLQEDGFDTYDANVKLGHNPDGRDYWPASKILFDLGITKVRLITNNPDKEFQLKKYGIEVSQKIPVKIKSNINNHNYLKTKKIKFNHKL